MGNPVRRLLVCSLVLACVHLAEAQTGKIYRVGVLVIGGADLYGPLKGFREGLKDLGYIEGKNLLLDIPVKNTHDEIRPIAKSFVEKKYDVIAAIGATTSLMAKEITQDIPIVFINPLDPVGAGLVKSIAHPEGNVTGVARGTDVELQGKRLQVFAEAVA